MTAFKTFSKLLIAAVLAAGSGLAPASPRDEATATKPFTNRLISNDAIGAARLGMTLGALKKVLRPAAQFKVQSPFMVDLDAVAVIESGVVHYFIVYNAGTRLKDSDVIASLITDNPRYQTAQGVGPGTPLQRAEAVLGKASLGYHTENESREGVEFSRQPAGNIAFTPMAAGKEFAGIYGSHQSGPAFATDRYHPSAVIQRVWVAR